MEKQVFDIACRQLDGIKRQYLQKGEVSITNSRPLTEARKAVLANIAPGVVVLKSPQSGNVLEIPIIEDSQSQSIIRRAREEGKKSLCWWRKVGCVVADENWNVVDSGQNNPVGEGKFCQLISLTPEEVIKLLVPGERLEFCTARHDVPTVVSRAARMGVPLGGYKWGLSMEPCDHCANLLEGVRPSAVYVDFGQGRYYSPLGLEILAGSRIPTFFVKMPEE